MVIDTGPKKYDEREHSSEWIQKSVQKRFDRADVVRPARLVGQAPLAELDVNLVHILVRGTIKQFRGLPFGARSRGSNH